MELKIIYEDKNLLVIDKPAGIVVFPAAPEDEPRQRREGKIKEKTIIDLLLEKYPRLAEVGPPPRYGIVHRLDKDTSGILLVAKNNESLAFLQKQFKSREVGKKYIALVVGNIKQNRGTIETLIGRSPKDRKKQKVYLEGEPGSEGKRKAITDYKILKRYKNYTLLEVYPKTGRKHQIRCHLSYLSHPIAGDKLYGFKNQPRPKGLKRHFLHASWLRVKLFQLLNGEIIKEFLSELPEELAETLENLEEIE